MTWVITLSSLYVLIGLTIVTLQRKQLLMELTGECYSSKGSLRFKLFLTIMHILAVLVWPIVLRRKNRKRNQRLYVMRDVAARFTSVSRDRREELEEIELSLITCKFITVYESLGLKMYEEHLEYELVKYREEGLREDYKGLCDTM